MFDLEPHVLAVLGAAIAAIGAGLAVWGLGRLTDRAESSSAESLLAPTLAVDTLDPDLRVAYMRTLVIDARLQVSGDESDDAQALGRELRRAIVAAQAARYQTGPDASDEDALALVEEAANAVEDREDLHAIGDWLIAARSARHAAHRRIRPPRSPKK